MLLLLEEDPEEGVVVVSPSTRAKRDSTERTGEPLNKSHDVINGSFDTVSAANMYLPLSIHPFAAMRTGARAVPGGVTTTTVDTVHSLLGFVL